MPPSPEPSKVSIIVNKIQNRLKWNKITDPNTATNNIVQIIHRKIFIWILNICFKSLGRNRSENFSILLKQANIHNLMLDIVLLIDNNNTQYLCLVLYFLIILPEKWNYWSRIYKMRIGILVKLCPSYFFIIDSDLVLA